MTYSNSPRRAVRTESVEKSVVISDVAELARSLTVLLERLVGRGCDHEVYGFRRQKVHPPGIAQMKIMPRRNRSDRRLYLCHQSLIARDPRQIALRVRQLATRLGNERPRLISRIGLVVSRFFRP